MADVFDEVDEDLRKDKAEELWKKYGKYVIGLAVLIVAATAGYKGWQEYTKSQYQTMANQFDIAVRSGRTESYSQADTLLSQIVEKGDSYSGLALLQQAAFRVKSGDISGAVAVYDILENDTNTDQIYRDLAVVLSVMNQIDHGDSEVLLAKIAPQTEEDKAWRFTAREIAALLALKSSNKSLAKEYLQRNIDGQDIPQSAQQRAQELLKIANQ